jgi:hypothetical protein
MEVEESRLLAEDDPILADDIAPVLPRTVREFMRTKRAPAGESAPDESATAAEQVRSNSAE